jgi:hypothetical protein
MKIALVYIYPENGHNGHIEKALKFMETYHKYPPLGIHDTVVVCNGGPADNETRFLFSSMPGLTLIEHDDSGWDIGGFQKAAQSYSCDLMIFCGGSSYFKRAGWMIRIVQSFQTKGDTLFGSTGNTGDMNHNVYPHIRTTGFWCNPTLMNRYPIRVTQRGTHGQRYEFEHGFNSITNFVVRNNLIPWVVSWEGEYTVQGSNMIPNGFRNGDQSNILIGDRLTAWPFGPDA